MGFVVSILTFFVSLYALYSRSRPSSCSFSGRRAGREARVSRPWQLRHKLVFGLALVVACVGLLLGGAVYGLSSLFDSADSNQRKVDEMRAVTVLRDAILEICSFPSTNDPEKPTTLRDYLERMPEGQESIYYATGESRAALENSPHMEAFRAKGYEAYEFHDRYASMVTIGSFNSVGTPRADGKIEINPQAHTIMQTFGAERKTVPGQVAAQVGNPKFEAGIALDIQPMLVEVPKRSLGAQYERPALTSRF